MREDSTAEIVAYHGRAKTLEIPDELDGHSVAAIGDEAFAECTELCTVVIPKSVTILGYHCFENGADVDIIFEGERVFIDKMLRCEKCEQNFVFPPQIKSSMPNAGFREYRQTVRTAATPSGIKTQQVIGGRSTLQIVIYAAKKSNSPSSRRMADQYTATIALTS